MITVVAAVALILVGMSATIFPLDFVNAALDVVQDALGTNIQCQPSRSATSSCSPATPSWSRAACCRGSDPWADRMNFAPRLPTIILALVLILVGLLGTFVGAVPDLAGVGGETIGAWSLVIAAVVLLLGMIFEGYLSTRPEGPRN